MYNDTLSLIKELEVRGQTTVIAPHSPVKISRFEKDKEKLKKLYDLGYQDALETLDRLKQWNKKG